MLWGILIILFVYAIYISVIQGRSKEFIKKNSQNENLNKEIKSFFKIKKTEDKIVYLFEDSAIRALRWGNYNIIDTTSEHKNQRILKSKMIVIRQLDLFEEYEKEQQNKFDEVYEMFKSLYMREIKSENIDKWDGRTEIKYLNLINNYVICIIKAIDNNYNRFVEVMLIKK